MSDQNSTSTGPVGPPQPPDRGQGPRQSRRDLWVWILVLPLAVIVAVVVLGIVARTTWTSRASGNTDVESIPGRAAPVADVESIPITSALIEVHALERVGLGFSERIVLVDSALLERATLGHAAMVSSTPVLEAALAMVQVRKTQWFSRKPASALARLRKSISVRVVEGTDLIAVSFTGDASAEETAELATSVAVAYVMDVKKRAQAEADGTIALLRDQMRVKQGQLAEIRNSIRRARRSASPSDLPAQGGALKQRLRDLVARLADAAALVTLRRSQLEATTKLVEAGTLATSHHVRPRVAQDYRLRLLLDEQAKVASQRRAVTAGADAKGRTPEGLAKQLILLAEAIGRREKTLTQQAVADIQAERREALAAAVAQTVRAKEEYVAIEKRVQDIETIFIRLRQMSEEEASVKEQLDLIGRRVTEMTLKRANVLPVVLRRRAEVPDDN